MPTPWIKVNSVCHQGRTVWVATLNLGCMHSTLWAWEYCVPLISLLKLHLIAQAFLQPLSFPGFLVLSSHSLSLRLWAIVALGAGQKDSCFSSRLRALLRSTWAHSMNLPAWKLCQQAHFRCDCHSLSVKHSIIIYTQNPPRLIYITIWRVSLSTCSLRLLAQANELGVKANVGYLNCVFFLYRLNDFIQNGYYSMTSSS